MTYFATKTERKSELYAQCVVSDAVFEDYYLPVLDGLDSLGLNGGVVDSGREVTHEDDVRHVEGLACLFVELHHPVTGISQTGAELVGS